MVTVRGSKVSELCETVVDIKRLQGLINELEKIIEGLKEIKPQCEDHRLDEAWN